MPVMQFPVKRPPQQAVLQIELGKVKKLDVHGWAQIHKFIWTFSALFCTHVLIMNVTE